MTTEPAQAMINRIITHSDTNYYFHLSMITLHINDSEMFLGIKIMGLANNVKHFGYNIVH
jgi:hypothetical protein